MRETNRMTIRGANAINEPVFRNIGHDWASLGPYRGDSSKCSEV